MPAGVAPPAETTRLTTEATTSSSTAVSTSTDDPGLKDTPATTSASSSASTPSSTEGTIAQGKEVANICKAQGSTSSGCGNAIQQHLWAVAVICELVLAVLVRDNGVLVVGVLAIALVLWSLIRRWRNKRKEAKKEEKQDKKEERMMNYPMFRGHS